MKRIFTATIAVAAIALTGATEAVATTFPSLTRIYVASGVVELNTIAISGIMTAVSCSNMSGETASVRFVLRHENGVIAAGGTLLIGSLASRVVTTNGDNDIYLETQFPTAQMFGGIVEILSTESAVFCSAMIIRADGALDPAGVALHMVRFNPHPGTVE